MALPIVKPVLRILVAPTFPHLKHARYAEGSAKGEPAVFEWCPAVKLGEAHELDGYSHCPYCGIELEPLPKRIDNPEKRPRKKS